MWVSRIAGLRTPRKSERLSVSKEPCIRRLATTARSARCFSRTRSDLNSITRTLQVHCARETREPERGWGRPLLYLEGSHWQLSVLSLPLSTETNTDRDTRSMSMSMSVTVTVTTNGRRSPRRTHNKPTLRPVSAPPVELGLASKDEEAVMIAFGVFGSVSECRRLGVGASPSTLGSSRNPSVNGLAVSAPALAHAEEPAAGGCEAAWKEDTMSDGAVSMSGMPTAARPLESIPRRAWRCAFSDSRRVISCSRTSDQ
jgi:hypothetical protein